MLKDVPGVKSLCEAQKTGFANKVSRERLMMLTRVCDRQQTAPFPTLLYKATGLGRSYARESPACVDASTASVTIPGADEEVCSSGKLTACCDAVHDDREPVDRGDRRTCNLYVVGAKPINNKTTNRAVLILAMRHSVLLKGLFDTGIERHYHHFLSLFMTFFVHAKG